MFVQGNNLFFCHVTSFLGVGKNWHIELTGMRGAIAKLVLINLSDVITALILTKQ